MIDLDAHHPTSVSHVFINGVPLDPHEWSWDGHTLHITPAAVQRLKIPDGGTIRITYGDIDHSLDHPQEPHV